MPEIVARHPVGCVKQSQFPPPSFDDEALERVDEGILAFEPGIERPDGGAAARAKRLDRKAVEILILQQRQAVVHQPDDKFAAALLLRRSQAGDLRVRD